MGISYSVRVIHSFPQAEEDWAVVVALILILHRLVEHDEGRGNRLASTNCHRKCRRASVICQSNCNQINGHQSHLPLSCHIFGYFCTPTTQSAIILLFVNPQRGGEKEWKEGYTMSPRANKIIPFGIAESNSKDPFPFVEDSSPFR